MCALQLTYSAGIPTMNRPEELRRCVGLLLQQYPPPVEVIIVDDGALDVESVRTWFAGSNSRMVYARKQSGRPGVMRSMEEIVRLCESSWLLFLDDDIYLFPDFMVRIAEALESVRDMPPIAALCGIPIPESAGDGNVSGKSPGSRPRRASLRSFLEKIFLLNGGTEGRFLRSGFCTDFGQGTRPSNPYAVEHVPGGLGLWRTEILREYGFDRFYRFEAFDEGYAYGMDKEFAYRVSRRSVLLCVPNALAYHGRSTSSRMNPRALGRMKVAAQRHFFREVYEHRFLSTPMNAWAMLGQMMILLIAAFTAQGDGRRTRLAELAGMLEGFGVRPKKGC